MSDKWTKNKLIERLYARLPYSNQIKNMDIDSMADAIQFDWRATRFRIGLGSGYPSVYEVGEGVLKGSNHSILLEYIIRLEYSEAS